MGSATEIENYKVGSTIKHIDKLGPSGRIAKMLKSIWQTRTCASHSRNQSDSTVKPMTSKAVL